jgi:hypothetical protein
MRITYEYYCVLMSHSWSRHRVWSRVMPDGKIDYYIVENRND